MNICVKDSIPVVLRWNVEDGKLALSFSYSNASGPSALLNEAHRFSLPDFLKAETTAKKHDALLEALNERREAWYLRLGDGASCGECEVILLRDALHIPPSPASRTMPWLTTGLWLREGAKVQRLRSFPIRFAKTEEAAACTLDLDYFLAATHACGARIRPPGRFSSNEKNALVIDGLPEALLPHRRPDVVEPNVFCRSLKYLSAVEWGSLLEALDDRPYAGFTSLAPLCKRHIPLRGDVSTEKKKPKMYRGASLSTRLLVPTRYMLHEIPLLRGLFEGDCREGDATASARSLWLLDSLRFGESAKLFRSRQDAVYYALGYRETGILLRKKRSKNWWLGFDEQVRSYANVVR